MKAVLNRTLPSHSLFCPARYPLNPSGNHKSLNEVMAIIGSRFYHKVDKEQAYVLLGDVCMHCFAPRGERVCVCMGECVRVCVCVCV